MATELQAQLSIIRKSQIQSASLQQGRPSIFLSQKEAAAVDIQTVYDAAKEGLSALRHYDNRFDIYFETLLHPSSVDMQRELKSKEIFARIVQLCELHGTVWAFLEGVKKSGVPLPRSILVQRCLKDSAIIEAICDVANRALDVSLNGAEEADLAGVDRILSFCTAVQIEVAEERGFDDAKMRAVFTFLVNGLKGDRFVTTDSAKQVLQLWRRSACMVLVQLARKTSFAKPFIRVISNALSLAYAHGNEEHREMAELVLSTMIVLAQFQKLRVTGAFLAQVLDGDSEDNAGKGLFLQQLKKANESIDISALMTLVANTVLQEVLRSPKAQRAQDSCTLSSDALGAAFQEIVRAGLIDTATLSSLLSNLLMLVADSSDMAAERRGEHVQAIVHLIAQKHPLVLEQTVQDVMAKLKGESTEANRAKLRGLKAFLDEVFLNKAYHISAAGGTGLLLALNSDIRAVKLQAIKAFVKTIAAEGQQVEDHAALVESVLSILANRNPEIASAVWNVPVINRVAAQADCKVLLCVLQEAFSFWLNFSVMEAPKIGSSIVSGILHVLQEQQVARLLVDAGGDGFRHWYLHHVVCRCLFGGISDGLLGCTADESKSQLQGVVDGLACEAFKSVACSMHSHVQLLAAVKDMPKETSCAELSKALAEKIQKAAATSAQTAVAAFVAYVTATASKARAPDMLCVLRFLNGLHLKSAQLGSLETIAAEVVNGADSSLINVDRSVIVLSSYLTQLKPVTQKDSASSASSLSQLLETSFGSQAGYMLLARLLGSSHRELLKLVPRCLSGFFAAHSSEVLLEFALTRDLAQRLAAQHALVALIQSISKNAVGSSSNAVTLQVRESHVLLLLLLLAVRCCGDEDQEVRRCGLLLARQLQSLPCNVVLSLSEQSMSDMFALRGQPDMAALPCIRDLSSVGAILIAEEALILRGSATVVSALASKVFEPASKEAVHTAQVLLWIGCSVGYANAGLVEPLFAAAQQCSLQAIWPFLKSIITKGALAQTPAQALFGVVTKPLATIASAPVALQLEIVSWISEFLGAACAAAAHQLRSGVAEALCRVAGEVSNSEVSQLVFNALLAEQVRNPGNQAVLGAIRGMKVALATVVMLLDDSAARFRSSLDALSADEEQAVADAMDVSGEEEEDLAGAVVGISAPLQRLSSLVECLLSSAAIINAEKSQAAELSAVAAISLNALKHIDRPAFKSALSVEFSKGLLIDLAIACVTAGGDGILMDSAAAPAAVAPKKSNNRRKSQLAATDDSIGGASTTIEGRMLPAYCQARIVQDVQAILDCVSHARNAQMQSRGLTLLRLLTQLDPNSILPATGRLSQLLTSSATLMYLGREGLINSIIQTFLSFATEQAAASTPAVMQQVFQALCDQLQLMPQHRRTVLVQTALKTVDFSELALVNAANVLLVHAVSTFQAGVAEADGTAQFILLSKASQRKAHRELKDGVSEEFFTLLMDTVVARRPDVQVKVVIGLLHTAQQLVVHALELGPEHVLDGTKTLLDASSVLRYYNSLVSKQLAGHQDAADGRSTLVTVALLHLEFVLELLENKFFHQMLVNFLDKESEEAVVQESFLELADTILQLQGFSSTLEQGFDANKASSGRSYLSIRLEGQAYRVSSKALGKNISAWCFEALEDLQKLVDLPSFVAILQELIHHEQIEIRQRALVILGSRLRSLGEVKSSRRKYEVSLFIDLSSQLRKIVKETTSALSDLSRGGSGNEDVAALHHRITLTQSSLLCLEVLGRFFHTEPTMKGEVLASLGEMIALNQLTEQTLLRMLDSVKDADSYVELLKLLSSGYICAGSLTGVLGAAAFPTMPSMLTNMLIAVDAHGILLASSGTQQDQAPPSKKAGKKAATVLSDEQRSSILKARVLFVRSALASITNIVSELSTFVHPYLKQILSCVLRYCGTDVPEAEALEDDVTVCLSAISTKIPPRLSVPVLQEATPGILSQGHSIACRFAQLLSDTWKRMDRTTVVGHLQPITTTAALLLDYRRIYGEQNEEANEVLTAVTGGVVELCLKLTENELRSFVVRLNDWKDAQNKTSESSWRSLSRKVSFFALVEGLSDKLESIFAPLMATLWSGATEALGAFVAQAGKIGKLKQQLRKQLKAEGRKRKAEELADQLDEEQVALVNEHIFLSTFVLSSFQQNCANDSAGVLLDEVRRCLCIAAVIFMQARYEELMPVVADMLANTRDAFEDDESYASYCEESLTPCIAAMAVAIGKDMQWKPLNHKVLLSMRDKRNAVRIAAIKTLHALFTEVGEEYLLLLPECIPFLSELLEDDDEEVVFATRDAIKFIEELSGEKLDSYLQ